MELVFITGLSGAGKSDALKALEDLDYYCIDNMPPALVPDFVNIAQSSSENKAAICVDVRTMEFLKDIEGTLDTLRRSGISLKVIFLEAEDRTLVRRYSQTRRQHPLVIDMLAGYSAGAEGITGQQPAKPEYQHSGQAGCVKADESSIGYGSQVHDEALNDASSADSLPTAKGRIQAGEKDPGVAAAAVSKESMLTAGAVGLESSGNLLQAISREREMLAAIRQQADFVIDTSSMKPQVLRQHIKSYICDEDDKQTGFVVNVKSFGFKYGIPIDADMVVDMRFVPNPYYVKSLRELTGNSRKIQDYVFRHEIARDFLEGYLRLLESIIPGYMKEGKFHLNLACGCTGGHHRSVAMANRISQALRDRGYHVTLEHRDL